MSAGSAWAIADDVEIAANQLIDIESPIYLCRSTVSVVEFMARLPGRHYRQMRTDLPAHCGVIEPGAGAVALVHRIDRFGVIHDASGLSLRPFLVVVVDHDGGRRKGVSFLSADIVLTANANLPGLDPGNVDGSLRDLLGE